MKTTPKEIYGEYSDAKFFKSTVGDKGIAEQSRINGRFYKGDQWRGSGAGNERPLVRHNVIKRIGDFKMSQILSGKRIIRYTADGVPCTLNESAETDKLKDKILSGKENLSDKFKSIAEINLVTEALSNYRELCAEKLDFNSVCAKALKDAYISGTGIVYTYWDSNLGKKSGDIGCEVLSVNDVFFADPYTKSVEEQPYIIISGYYDTDAVIRTAKQFGATKGETEIIKNDGKDGKVLVLTKLYKEYSENGSAKILCTKVTENGVVRKPFDTKLTLYPLAIFSFEERDDIIYGDTEITYLIPNQIAINRMITANVWSSMSSGMPIMVVNGDTVTSEITNEPGQIIKVYGSNEDVKGAVSFVSPPDYSKDFCDNINNLIENTLTQSGATAAVLGDEILNNASALSSMKNSAIMSLYGTRCRYDAFLKQISLIWADFFIGCYKNRELKVADKNGVWYLPFNGEKYSDILVAAELISDEDESVSEKERCELLLTLYEKGIIDRDTLLLKMPETVLDGMKELVTAKEETV